MSFRKGRALEKIEEILDEPQKKFIVEKEKNIVEDNDVLLVANLKKLNSNLLLRLNDYEKNSNKLIKENRKLVNKDKNFNKSIEKIKLENEEKIKKIKLENEEKIKKIKLENEENKKEEKEKNKQKITELCQIEEKKRKRITEQQKKNNEKYNNQMNDLKIQHDESIENFKKEEKEKNEIKFQNLNEEYNEKIKKKENSLEEIYNLKTEGEMEKIIKEKNETHNQLVHKIQITEDIENSIKEQMLELKINLNNGHKFNNSNYYVICLCDFDKDNTNKILIENELNNIFPEIEYIPYFQFHSEYITRIISILKCLEKFLEHEEKNLIFFEYDFQWLFNKDIILGKLNSIKDIDFNLIVLNYNNLHLTYKNNDNDNDNLIGIKKNLNDINSFIINKKYTKKLMKILEIIITDIVKNKNNNNKLYENSFNKIIKDNKCYGMLPSLGKQRSIYNDEENMNCLITILDDDEILYKQIPYMYKIIKKASYNFSHNNYIYLNEKDDLSIAIIKYCYENFPKLDYLFFFRNGYKYTKTKIQSIFKKVIMLDSNLILDKNNKNFCIKLKKENLDLKNLINNKDFKIIDFN